MGMGLHPDFNRINLGASIMREVLMSLRTPLSQARGLGSAKTGTEHFIAQRLTAIALVPLLIWFIYSLISLMGAEYAAVVQWIQLPWVTVLLLLFILVLFHHAQLGLQVVMEDYIHHEALKITALITMKFIMFSLALAAVLAVLRIALGD